ncbi:MAG: ATP-dependent Clp protease adaptor ClpS [Muribaculaceae bacterium]|nr:ATP-dependent Clp protease adaptor ClpS [Muribaculaceae bacterium]
MTQEQKSSQIATTTKTEIAEPKKWKVIFHNDDFTPMDFVVYVLKAIFFKTDALAEDLMMKVHLKGKATVGEYPYDIALSKVNRTHRIARENNYPLKLTMAPVRSRT